jgi:hypothetical protein
MPDMIQVRAVDGRLYPWAPPRGGYVGYARAKEGETADHFIPAFGALKRDSGAVDVPNTAYYRRAIDSGDLERVGTASDDKEAVDASVPALPADLPSAPRAESEDKS